MLERGRHFITEEVETTVSRKEGSEILIGSILAGAGGVYAAICKYPTFRQGVAMLAKDVHRLTAGIISEILFLIDCNQLDAIHIEARSGVFGRLDAICFAMESLGVELERLKVSSACRRLETLSERLERVLKRIEDQSDLEYVKKNLHEIATRHIPPASRYVHVKKKSPSETELAGYTHCRSKLLDLLS